ncbi:MAG: nucleoside-diphosphate kinase [Dysgonamonadaceae bacterium]|nr:nucleoside-diphosphate kinase [Dysgonamonadaceae bacterium]MDD4729980.1 nucleoside-diphosphate kinase [Dysgonamonadaceae bacterium]
MQKTLVIIKPSAIQRGLVGDVISRFEKKGLQIVGFKMMLLTDDMIKIHYSHLVDKPFFKRIKDSMQATPVLILALKGVDAVEVVRNMSGSTNSRKALSGTIRGDFSMSVQENIVHASDSVESSLAELKRFFTDEELFDYSPLIMPHLYSNDEY